MALREKGALFWLMVQEVQGLGASSGDGVLSGSLKLAQVITMQR